MTGRWIETAVGAAVLITALLFGWQLLAKSDSSSGDTINVEAVFDNADGLSIGTDVRMAGIKIGRVASQHLDSQTYQAVLTIALDKAVPVPEDSDVRVLSDGLLGGNYLMVQPGGSDSMLAEGDQFQFTSDAVNLIDLISKAVFSSTTGSAE